MLTVASGGIGAAAARALADRGFEVVAVVEIRRPRGRGAGGVQGRPLRHGRRRSRGSRARREAAAHRCAHQQRRSPCVLPARDRGRTAGDGGGQPRRALRADAGAAAEAARVGRARRPRRVRRPPSCAHPLAARRPGAHGAAFSARESSLLYARSKLLGVLFTKALARRLAGTGVVANSCCPGLNVTGLGREAAGSPRSRRCSPPWARSRPRPARASWCGSRPIPSWPRRAGRTSPAGAA